MAIPDRLVEEVRDRAELVDLVADIVPLKRSGRTFRGPCPLHGGKGPNFSVDPARNIFKCFVCGEGGDVFSFPMKHFGMGFNEAVRWVADQVGIEIPDEQEKDDAPDPLAPYHEANAFATEWFRGQLLDPEEGREARDYLKARGITTEACERFDIGWAPASWGAFADAARTHGIDRDVLLELGLMKRSRQDDREPYDAFRGRVIFPIQDLGGRTVAFGGRVITEVEEHVPKYLNSPESPVYHKGDLLYGLRWSRGPIRKQETALVVEGYMDFVALASHGVDNAVAPLGTAMTPAQASLISRYAGRVILLYDSDTAGLKATFRSADELLGHGVEVLVATMPDGQDPDSIVRSGGPGALRGYLNDAVDVLERKIQILERRDFFSSIAGRRRAVDSLLPTARAASDEVLRGLYIDRIAERTGVDKQTVAREVEEGIRKEAARATRMEANRSRERQPDRARSQPAPPSPRLGAERNLLMLLLRDDYWVEKVGERIGAEDFSDETDREIFIELVLRNAEGHHGDHTEMLPHLSEHAAARVQELMGDPEGWNMGHPDRFFHENVREIEARAQRRRLAAIEAELRGSNDTRQMELLREMRDLRQAMERSGIHGKVGSRGSADDR